MHANAQPLALPSTWHAVFFFCKGLSALFGWHELPARSFSLASVCDVHVTSHAAVCPQVTQEDLHRVAEATGAQIQTTVNNLDTRVLGTCADFEEQQVGLHCLQQHQHNLRCIM